MNTEREVERIERAWFSLQNTATTKQKDEIGKAFISNVLGLGDDISNRFAQSDFDTHHQIGMRQGGAEDYTSDLPGFWEKVRTVFPDIHNDDDIHFLVTQGGVVATVRFLWILEFAISEPSPVLIALSTNAHAYK